VKPELLVHIGRPKVGSTALQGFLNYNRQALAAKGICYPRTGLYQGASHQFSLVFLPNLPDYPVVASVATDQLYAQLAQEVTEAGTGRAVLSSEHFWLVKPQLLKPLLLEHFDVRIVAYLRRQDDVLLSSFIQEIRGGSLSLDCPMDDYLADRHRLKLLDYDAVLRKWEKAFGQENIEVRLYENLQPGSGIVRDFLSLLGVEDSDDFDFVDTRRNGSPALDLLRIQEVLRSYPVGEIPHRQLSGIITEVSEHLGMKDDLDPRQLITQAQRRRVLEQFESSNQRLFQRYDCGGTRFPPLAETEQEDAAPSTVPAPDRQVQALLGILAYQQRQIQVLLNRVSHLERSAGGSASAPAQPRGPEVNPPGPLRRLLRKIGRR